MREKAAAKTAGFSLIELMMAMVVTLIVTGSIYGLLSGGQSAFRVQPERTERQQNIRNAMDAIMRDIATAGVGMPDLTQTFTPALDGAGVAGPNGPTDILEMVTNPDNFPNEDVCHTSGTRNAGPGATEPLRFVREPALLNVTPPAPPRSVILLGADGLHWAPAQVTDTSGGTTNIDTNCSGPHSILTGVACTGTGYGNFPADPCEVSQVTFGEIIRYAIRIDAGLVPSLWRTHPLDPSKDQVIARGIEDLQVEYIQANTACTAATPCPPGTPGAPPVVLSTPPLPADYNTIITQVQVTLSARSNVQGLQGQTRVVPGGQNWLRGSLTSVGSPRAALYALNKQPVVAPATAPLWQ